MNEEILNAIEDISDRILVLEEKIDALHFQNILSQRPKLDADLQNIVEEAHKRLKGKQ